MAHIRQEILETAGRLIDGDRDVDYDNPYAIADSILAAGFRRRSVDPVALADVIEERLTVWRDKAVHPRLGDYLAAAFVEWVEKEGN